ncbi:MAG: hypothetical protein AB1352_00755, partial [Patescibacteria group bacterium]
RSSRRGSTGCAVYSFCFGGIRFVFNGSMPLLSQIIGFCVTSVSDIETNVHEIEKEAIRVKQTAVVKAVGDIEGNRVKQAELQKTLEKAQEAKEKLEKLKQNSEVFNKLPKDKLVALQSLIDKIPDIENIIKQLNNEIEGLLKVEGVEEAQQNNAITEHYLYSQHEKLTELDPEIAQLIANFETWADEKNKAEAESASKKIAFNNTAEKIKTLLRTKKTETNDQQLLKLLDRCNYSINKKGWGKQFVEDLEKLRDGYGLFGHFREKKTIDAILHEKKMFEDVDSAMEECDKAEQEVERVEKSFTTVTDSYRKILDKARESEEGEEGIKSSFKRDGYALPEDVKSLAVKTLERVDLFMKRQLDVYRDEDNGEKVRGAYFDFTIVKEKGTPGEKRLLQTYEQFLRETKGWELEKPNSEEEA